MEHKNRMGSRLQIRTIMSQFGFSSLFSRLLCVYISIAVIMLMMLFITFTHAFQTYFVEYTQQMMLKQAKTVATEFYKEGAYSISREETLGKIIDRIQVMDEYLQAITWVVDEDGEGRIIYRDRVERIQGEVPSEANISAVFEGHPVGLENGFKEYFSTPVLTVGYPLVVGEDVQYALFIHTPMPYILKTIDEVRNLILKVVGIVGSLVIVWIYFISKRMSKPLKEMNGVAKTIANGHFNRRIQVRGKDEIAQLGLSLNHMASELDKAEESRRSFIANVSHDLRSPLTSIQGFVTAILDGTISSEKQERYLKIVLDETHRMINMTNTILELNRMQEKAKNLDKNIFNINCLIERTVDSFEKKALEKGVSISVELDKQHFLVEADFDGISRVVQNLLDNAMKFVNENGNVKVSTQYHENKVWVLIANSGEAIPKDKQKDIWNRFYKVDSSRGKDKTGVGLGLVIVKEIIKQHDEVVGVTSEKDEPVVFYFSLEPKENRPLKKGQKVIQNKEACKNG